MYLDHFKLNEFPFALTPNIGFFCGLKPHQDALNTLLIAIRSGEGFIKIVGEVGSGKTLLCRKLLDNLREEFTIAYLPNPDFNPTELRRAVLRELGGSVSSLEDQHELLTHISHYLLTLHEKGKRILLLIDEAQVLSRDSLEALRLLTNVEGEKTHLMQVVLFGQPELDHLLNQPNLRQFKQRISFTHYLPPLSSEDLDTYLFHRLAIAGHTLGNLFTKRSRKILLKASKGLPRIVNILCHKALLVAYGRGEQKITPKVMQLAIRDTEVSVQTNYRRFLFLGVGFVLLIAFIFLIFRKGII